MAENSNIEWCDSTFNPWIGCQKVSEGCKFCYAETLTKNRMGKNAWGPNGKRYMTKTWGNPRKWNAAAQKEGTRAKVFCCSMADVFEDWTGPIHDNGGNGGETYVVYDIAMRMLTPRELYSCQGFRKTYIIDRGHDGRPITKTEQVRMVGNSVSPVIPRALVEANCPWLIVRDKRRRMA